ncbi:MAG: protein DA1 [Candidatus Latescibacteria bacterium]|nr:protein DA1 [Candidatus Latescibacterota bacterium]NIO56201.1 protein DA1 [Candidatus Latescibacterota bacterium]
MSRFWVLLLASCILLSFTAPTAQTQEARTCKACGEQITGSYFETGRNYYHPHCFTCEYCTEPIEESYVVYKGKNYHRACFEKHVAIRCSVCNEIIKGEYFLDHWGNAYHKHHEEKIIRCDFCNRFIVGNLIKGMVRYPDGRHLCGKCSVSAVTELEIASSLMFDVAKQLGKFGLHVDPREIELHLVGQDKLRELSSDRSGDTTGFTDYAINKNLFGHVKYQSIKVYVLYGMPKVQMISTLAHELTHVWQFINGQLKQEQALSEGSCNFASYLVLRKIGGREGEFIIENMLNDKDPIYGEGFRRVKRYAEKNGLASWLKLLKMKDPSISTF